MTATTVDCSLQSFLRPLAQLVPPQLISAAWLDRMGETACWLPGADARLGLECDLCDERPQADLLFSLRAHRQGGNHLRAMSPPPDVAQHDIWWRLRALGELWCDNSHTLDRVWLEFDIDSEHRFLPSFFFRPRPADAEGHRYQDYHDHIHRVFEVLGVTAGEGLRPCIERISEYAPIFQMGVMLPRRTDMVRLCLWVKWPHLPRLLSDLGLTWGLADVAELTEALRDVPAVAAGVQIDVGAAVRPAFDIEVRLPRLLMSPAEARANPVLRWLVGRGYASALKTEALMDYPGVCSVADAPHLWPTHMNAWNRLADDLQISTLARWIQYVKIIYRPYQRARSKAYLGMKHAWKALDSPMLW